MAKAMLQNGLTCHGVNKSAEVFRPIFCLSLCLCVVLFSRIRQVAPMCRCWCVTMVNGE